MRKSRNGGSPQGTNRQIWHLKEEINTSVRGGCLYSENVNLSSSLCLTFSIHLFRWRKEITESLHRLQSVGFGFCPKRPLEQHEFLIIHKQTGWYFLQVNDGYIWGLRHPQITVSDSVGQYTLNLQSSIIISLHINRVLYKSTDTWTDTKQVELNVTENKMKKNWLRAAISCLVRRSWIPGWNFLMTEKSSFLNYYKDTYLLQRKSLLKYGYSRSFISPK